MNRLTTDFWTRGISFYLDGVSFVHITYKTHPVDQARTYSMTYQTKKEGLEITAKGSKEGIEEKVA